MSSWGRLPVERLTPQPALVPCASCSFSSYTRAIVFPLRCRISLAQTQTLPPLPTVNPLSGAALPPKRTETVTLLDKPRLHSQLGLTSCSASAFKPRSPRFPLPLPRISVPSFFHVLLELRSRAPYRHQRL